MSMTEERRITNDRAFPFPVQYSTEQTFSKVNHGERGKVKTGVGTRISMRWVMPFIGATPSHRKSGQGADGNND